MTVPCRICGKSSVGRELCRTHYNRWYRTGTTELKPRPEHPKKKTLAMIRAEWEEKADTSPGPTRCWPWRGRINPNGYGQLDNSIGTLLAHRIGYEYKVGSIPDGMTIDHLCFNRACVNPSHLEVVTLEENIRRSHNNPNRKRATHCPAGHPYDEENTYIANGRRHCRACKKLRGRAVNARLKAERAAKRGPVVPRTECVHGHPWVPANLYYGSKGRPYCRTCGLDSQRRYQQRKRSKE